MRSPHRLVILLVPVALLACTSDDDADPADTSASETTEAIEPTSGTTETVRTASIPSDARVIEVEELGVRFAAPAGWETVDPDELDDDPANTVLDELAERAGVTPDELAASIEEGVELYVFSDEPDDSYTANINILAAPADAVPSDAELTADFEALGANNVEIERSTTSAGAEAVSARYTVRLGDLRVRGVSVFTETDDGVVNITASTTNRREANDLGELIRSSIGPID